MTSCGKISLLTTFSAKSSLILASLPRASAADCEMDGTLSRRRGLSNAITPADCKA